MRDDDDEENVNAEDHDEDELDTSDCSLDESDFSSSVSYLNVLFVILYQIKVTRYIYTALIPIFNNDFIGIYDRSFIGAFRLGLWRFKRA